MPEIDALTAAASPPDETSAKLRLTRPHQLIKRTMEAKEVKDKWGYVTRPAWQGVDVRVSKSAKRNALIVLDRLFKSLEKQDIQVAVHDDQYGSRGTFAVRGRQDKVPLYVTEITKKSPHVPTKAEVQQKEQNKYSARIPKFDHVPTGTLELIPGGVVDLSSEDALARLIAKATDEILRQLDEVAAKRKVEEAARNREYERQRQQQDEKKRAEALANAVGAFRQYRDMMDYIEEVRRFGRVPDNQRKDGQTLAEWLHWAEWRARCIHPLG